MSARVTGRPAGRKVLQPGQISRLVITDRSASRRHVVLETDRLIEAPNWTVDGRWLIVNGEGLLHRIAIDGDGGLSTIETGGVTTANNDHVLSFDGQTIFFSATGHIYEIPIAGGTARRVSPDRPKAEPRLHYVHGISPDGTVLAYVAVEPRGDDPIGTRYCAVLPVAGGQDVAVSDHEHIADAPEFSPDGEWIYFNSEQARRGHAQLFRTRPDRSETRQLTFDERVNWFPHVSPDGQWIVYLSYGPGTQGHPADLDVQIRLLPAAGGATREICAFFGGQGSLNVNSWAPDSDQFAYVEYPFIG